VEFVVGGGGGGKAVCAGGAVEAGERSGAWVLARRAASSAGVDVRA
jgi:hypothetical protein